MLYQKMLSARAICTCPEIILLLCSILPSPDGLGHSKYEIILELHNWLNNYGNFAEAWILPIAGVESERVCTQPAKQACFISALCSLSL